MSDSPEAASKEIDKDQAIAYLYAKTKKLEKIFLQIDRDVAEAAEKYLKEWKPSFHGEKLKFSQFVALLVGEMTKVLRYEWVNSKDSPLRKAMEESVIKEFEERTAQEILADKLSVIVNVIRINKVSTSYGEKEIPVYRATCLERMIYVESDSKEDVVTKWLTKLRSKMVKGPITRLQLLDKKLLKDLTRMFTKGKDLHEEKVDKYLVTVKGYPEKIF